MESPYRERAMSEPTINDLANLARALGVEMSGQRLADVLPEVRRIWAHARRLRELLADADEPAMRFRPRE